MNRGLSILAASLAALILSAASAAGPKPARPSLVELVVLLQKPSAAAATGDARGPYLAALSRGQDAFASRLERVVPGARVRWPVPASAPTGSSPSPRPGRPI